MNPDVWEHTAAPSLVFGMLAGAFVDRYDRKRIMIGCDALRALLVLAIPFKLQFHIGWLYAAGALLRSAAAAPGLLDTRAATVADVSTLAQRVPEVSRSSAKQSRDLAARTLVAIAPAGTAILRKGDESDAGYFSIEGREVAGGGRVRSARRLGHARPGPRRTLSREAESR